MRDIGGTKAGRICLHVDQMGDAPLPYSYITFEKSRGTFCGVLENEERISPRKTAPKHTTPNPHLENPVEGIGRQRGEPNHREVPE